MSRRVVCPECGGPVTWFAEWRCWICGPCWIEIRRAVTREEGENAVER